MNLPVLSIRELCVSFLRKHPESEIPIVHGVSFDIFRGRMTALVGESGSGKSVTAMSLLQLHRSVKYGGEAFYDGKNLLNMNTGEIRRIRGNRIAMIFQEPMTSLNPIMTVGRQLVESVLTHQPLTAKKEAMERVLHYLDLVRLPDPSGRIKAYPHEFSGGQRQRIMIAMALLNDPDVLITDEPTTALDVTVQEQILNLIKDLQERNNMGVLFVSHDLNLVKDFSDSVCIMKNRVLVETGETGTIFNRPSHEYTKALLEAEPRGYKPLVTSDDYVLEAENLQVHYPLKKSLLGKPREVLKAVDGVNLCLDKGQTLGIVGESGCGKTTLGKAFMRLAPLSGGKFRIGNIYSDDISLDALNMGRYLARKIQMVFQDPYGSLPARFNAGRIIREPLDIHFPDMSREEKEARVDAIIEEVSLPPDTRYKYPHEFSGGQRQRISIARALILKPEIIILDEPTSALDRTTQMTIIDLLRNIQARYEMSFIFISHDLSVVLSLCDRILLMREGRVLEENSSLEFFRNPRTEYGREFVRGSHVIAENHETPYLIEEEYAYSF